MEERLSGDRHISVRPWGSPGSPWVRRGADKAGQTLGFSGFTPPAEDRWLQRAPPPPAASGNQGGPVRDGHRQLRVGGQLDLVRDSRPKGPAAANDYPGGQKNAPVPRGPRGPRRARRRTGPAGQRPAGLRDPPEHGRSGGPPRGRTPASVRGSPGLRGARGMGPAGRGLTRDRTFSRPQMSPRYLQSNSSSHTRPFSAIAELLGEWRGRAGAAGRKPGAAVPAWCGGRERNARGAWGGSARGGLGGLGHRVLSCWWLGWGGLDLAQKTQEARCV